MKPQKDLQTGEFVQQYFGYVKIEAISILASYNADLEAHIDSDCCLTYIRGNVGLHALCGASKAHIMWSREKYKYFISRDVIALLLGQQLAGTLATLLFVTPNDYQATVVRFAELQVEPLLYLNNGAYKH